MSDKFCNLSCEMFSQKLASKSPAPGGGGAAAYVGALAAALCTMAGNFTVGKKKYANVEADIVALMERTEECRKRLVALIDEDAAAFEPLSKAYSMPKDSENYEQIMRAAIINACKAPMEIMRCSCNVVELLKHMNDKCSRLMISDVGCGAIAAKAAIEQAAMNVFVNTRLLPDDAEALSLESEAEIMLKKYAPEAEKLAESIMFALRNKAEVLVGAPVANEMMEDLQLRILKLKEHGVVPKLAVIRLGEDEGAIAYERNAVRRCRKAGIKTSITILPADCEQEDVIKEIERINSDDSIHGCLLFRPLPAHIDERKVCDALAPEKDVDCITSASLDGIFTGASTGFPPCTAQACIELLDYYGYELSGKNVTVIGRSLVIGRPVSMMLQTQNATVTMCHTKTADMAAACRNADILVVAAGKAGVVDETCVKPGQIVIDVGINSQPDGSMCGDVNFSKTAPVVKAITPVPGGVGTITTAVLVKHITEAAEKSMNK